MKRFSMFSEEIDLYESISSPVEFYMTADTKLPNEIYGAFEVGGAKYSISLVKSKVLGIYVLDFGLLMGAKKRKWYFKNSSHIRICLSTIIKFIEAIMPFIGKQMKGIVVELPKKVKNERFNRFMNLLIRKTFITVFRNVNVKDPEETKVKQWVTHMFLIKKQYSPKTVFSHKRFSNYDFDSDGSVESDMLGEVETLKVEKKSFTAKPSNKYKFDHFETEIALGDKFMDKIVDLVPVNQLTDGSEKVNALNDLKQKVKDKNIAHNKKISTWEVELHAKQIDMVQKQKIAAEKDAKFDSILSKMTSMTSDTSLSEYEISSKAECESAIQMAFSLMTEKLKQYGFDESKVDWNNMEYRLKNVKSDYPNVFAAMGKYKFKSNSTFNETNQANMIALMKKIAEGKIKDLDLTGDEDAKETPEYKKLADDLKTTKSELDSAKDDHGAAHHDYYEYADTKPKKDPSHSKMLEDISTLQMSMDDKILQHDKANLDFDYTVPNEFQSDPALDSGGDWDMKNTEGKSHITSGNDMSKLINHVMVAPPKGLGMQESYDSLTETQRDAAKAYTGSGYSNINDSMRDSWKSYESGAQNISIDSDDSDLAWQRIKNLSKAFEKIKPLPEPMWVFRRCNFSGYKDLKIGEDMIDSGFLSCSINPNISWAGNIRLAIYLPKGFKCIPMFNSSHHPTEKEVILPPMTVLRPTEIIVHKSSYHSNYPRYKMIAVGTAHVDFVAKIKKLIGEETENMYIGDIMTEGKTSEKDMTLPPKKEMDKIMKAIKTGKLKLDKGKNKIKTK